MEAIPNPNISDLSLTEWCRAGTPGTLKLIFSAWAALNRAAANANGATLYWFLFNDFVTPLTVLYKSSVGWFAQGPLPDKLVWLQHSVPPHTSLLIPTLSPLQRDSPCTQWWLSLFRCGVQGRKQVDWLMVCLINGDTSTRWRLAYRQLTAALPHWQKPHYSSNIVQKCHGPGGASAAGLARLAGTKLL